MFQLLNEIGDAGDSRGTLVSVTSLMEASPVVADAVGSGMVAASVTRVRKLDEGGGGAGVLVDSGIGSVSDGRYRVGGESGLQTRKTRF